MATAINKAKIETFIREQFDTTIVPTLVEYIKIPSLSPSTCDLWFFFVILM